MQSLPWHDIWSHREYANHESLILQLFYCNPSKERLPSGFPHSGPGPGTADGHQVSFPTSAQVWLMQVIQIPVYLVLRDYSLAKLKTCSPLHFRKLDHPCLWRRWVVASPDIMVDKNMTRTEHTILWIRQLVLSFKSPQQTSTTSSVCDVFSVTSTLSRCVTCFKCFLCRLVQIKKHVREFSHCCRHR